jgi:hypothetical protein
VKASDITDEAFLAAIGTVLRKRPGIAGLGANRWDIAAVLDGHPEWVGLVQATDGTSVSIPEKVVLAKAKRLVQRGLIGGCPCGCRGDFTRTMSIAAEGSPS